MKISVDVRDLIKVEKYQHTAKQNTLVESWPTMDQAAFYGLAGEIVRTIEPQSEADPVALLISVLVAVGNMLGRHAWFQVEETRHHANLYAVLVGATSKARKGTSWDRIKAILKEVDPDYIKTNVRSSFSSGEGLIWDLRDGGEHQDKRVLILESEYAKLLRLMGREGNTLSPTLRDGWDHGNLAIRTKTKPAAASRCHISFLGHCTKEELGRYLTDTESGNGFANRFLFIAVRRSKNLPFGGRVEPHTLEHLVIKLREVRNFFRVGFDDVWWDLKAQALWRKEYAGLAEGKPGLLGAIIGRAEAQVVRLALIYAMLDKKTRIGVPHLTAALAVWRYAEASAKMVFGQKLGDSVADAVLRDIEIAAAEGISRNDLGNTYGRHRDGMARLSHALVTLTTMKLVFSEKRKTIGRPIEIWKSAQYAE